MNNNPEHFKTTQTGNFFPDHSRNTFETGINPVCFPFDKINTDIFCRKTEIFKLTAGLCTSLQAVCSGSNHNLFVYLLSAFCYTLHRYANEDSVTVFIPPLAGTDNSMRLFPVNVRINVQTNYSAFLLAVKKSIISAYNSSNTGSVSENKICCVSLAGFHSPILFQENTPAVFIDFTENYGTVSGKLEYNGSAYNEDTIIRIKNHFLAVLKETAENIEIPLLAIEMLSREEKNCLLFAFNNTAAEYPVDKTIHELFTEQAERTPASIALVSRNITLTYKELDCRANQLADYLRGRGVQADTVIGLLMDRSIEMIISILAVLKAGGAWLPLDPALPPNRIKKMLADSKTLFVLDRENFDQTCREPCTGTKANRVYPENTAYVIFTSGTTGTPRGVAVAHRSLVNLCYWHIKKFRVTGEDTCAQYASFSFDASVWEIFPYLICGAAVHILPDDIRLNLEKLNAYYEKNRITIAFLPTGIGEQFIRLPNNSLTRLLLGGEKLVTCAPQKYKIFNNYGPTETTVVAACFEVDKLYEKIPIGKPVDNTVIYILDRHNRTVPVSGLGQIFIGGDCLAISYINNDAETKRNFPENPFLPGKKMYQSGDLGKWLADGNIEFYGRNDHQVKIRGFRIELDEITRNVLLFGGIKQCTVIPVHNNGNSTLACFFTAAEKINCDNLKNFLSGELPSYMIPSRLRQVDVFPLNNSGKIDQHKLLAENRTTGLEEPVALNALEKKIAEIWQRVLGTPKLGIHDNFFEAGGDSLKLIKCAALLQEEYTVDVNALFTFQTVKKLAEHMEKNIGNVIKKPEFTGSNLWRINFTPGTVKKIRDYYKKFHLQKSITGAEKEYRHILLTGACGFLGIYLLRSLLENSSARIYLLVRAESDSAAENRIIKKTEYYFGNGFYSLWKNRLCIIRGDLAYDRLGVEDEIYRNLAGNIDCIINSAALTRHYGEYSAFYNINAGGVKRLLELAKSGRPKDINHISTISIALGDLPAGDSPLFTEYDLDLGQKHENFYNETKFLAEKLLAEERKNGININIYRSGSIFFDSQTGRFSEDVESNAFCRLFCCFLKLGNIPEIKNPIIDFTFVDNISRAVCALYNRKDTVNETFHLYNPHTLNTPLLAGLITASGVPLQVLAPQEFFRELKNDNRPEAAAMREILAYYNIFSQLDTVRPIIVCAKTLSALKPAGFSWTIPQQAHLSKMLAGLRKINYL